MSFLAQIIGESFLSGNLILGMFFTIYALIVGIISSSLGIGGGFITTPSLILIGVEPGYAIGTVLFMIIFTAFSATVAYSRREKLIEYRLGIFTAAFTVIGAIFGSLSSSILTDQAPELFRLIFVVFLIPIAVKMIFYPKRKKVSNKDSPNDVETEEIGHDEIIFYGFERREVLSSILGLIAGFSSGLLGIGGGVVMVPILVHIGKLSIHKAAATSMFIMIFTSIAGAFIKISNGQVHPDLAIFLVIGIIIGAQIGPRLVRKVNTVQLQRIFGFTMIIALISIAIGRDQFIEIFRSILSLFS
ncbi:MAG: sulfite exporter TauE/SafE family protein [Candidatus Hodarchaeales archaeon]|jgi:uncharacterized membrane protein YfcA